MTTAELGDTNAQGAVMATSPASMPLQAMVMSGLPKLKYQKSIAAADPATAARLVFIATTEMRRSVEPSVEPGLKPIQPNSRMKVPVTTKTRLCAGNALRLPVGAIFSEPRSEDDGQSHGREPADGVDHGGAGEVHVAMSVDPSSCRVVTSSRRPRPSTRRWDRGSRP